MKLKFPLIGIIICLLSVFSFAKSDAMSYYMVSPEKVAEYVKLDLLKSNLHKELARRKAISHVLRMVMPTSSSQPSSRFFKDSVAE